MERKTAGKIALVTIAITALVWVVVSTSSTPRVHSTFDLVKTESACLASLNIPGVPKSTLGGPLSPATTRLVTWAHDGNGGNFMAFVNGPRVVPIYCWNQAGPIRYGLMPRLNPGSPISYF